MCQYQRAPWHTLLLMQFARTLSLTWTWRAPTQTYAILNTHTTYSAYCMLQLNPAFDVCGTYANLTKFNFLLSLSPPCPLLHFCPSRLVIACPWLVQISSAMRRACEWWKASTMSAQSVTRTQWPKSSSRRTPIRSNSSSVNNNCRCVNDSSSSTTCGSGTLPTPAVATSLSRPRPTAIPSWRSRRRASKPFAGKCIWMSSGSVLVFGWRGHSPPSCICDKRDWLMKPDTLRSSRLRTSNGCNYAMCSRCQSEADGSWNAVGCGRSCTTPLMFNIYPGGNWFDWAACVSRWPPLKGGVDMSNIRA